MQIDYYSDTSEDTIDAEEYALYELIMEYRVSLGLSVIPLSKALTITASRHVLDTVYNLDGYDGHNWSDAPFDLADASTFDNMWSAPTRLDTGYTSEGFEISAGYLGSPATLPDFTAQLALDGWKASPGHNEVITEQGPWNQPFQAIGIALHGSVAHVWFGRTSDPTGLPGFEAGVGPSAETPINDPVEVPDDDPVQPPIDDTDENETLVGTVANDVLIGGAGSDILTGGAGDDVIIAGTSMTDNGTGDTARFEGSIRSHLTTGGMEYAVVRGPGGSRDKLFGIEYIEFDDGLIQLRPGSALDGLGEPADFVTAERVALLYEAALNRDGNIDLPGLNFYIEVTERDGLSDVFLAENLMSSPEFTANFGDVTKLSNREFLEQIYLNVLDRDSDLAGRQFYLDLLNDGTISKALALADIAISPETRLNQRPS